VSVVVVRPVNLRRDPVAPGVLPTAAIPRERA